MRPVLPAFLVVLALLAAVAVLGREEPTATRAPAPLATVAERVERLRGLEFRERPEPVRVTAEQARREGLADLDRAYPAARRRADEAFYERLGLFPAGTDLRDVSATVFSEQVAGYYDPRDGRLRVVEGAGGPGGVMGEIILAHELAHALEDQAIGLDTRRADAPDDSGYAYRALVEGTATRTMFEYLARHFDAEEALGGLLAGSLSASSSTPLPPFVMNSLVWPYVGGEAFVSSLQRRGGWRLVDVALRHRPPVSTEQVLHPAKWLLGEPPAEVRAPRAPGLGEPDAEGVFGEWQTRELLRLAGGQRSREAAGWGGDAYASWEEALAIRWAWDTARDAREFRGGLEELVAAGRLGGSAEIGERDRTITLAVADDPALARRLAAATS